MKTKVKEIKPPTNILPDKTQFKIFVAGSIEQGKAEKWQQHFRYARQILELSGVQLDLAPLKTKPEPD